MPPASDIGPKFGQSLHRMASDVIKNHNLGSITNHYNEHR
jgi:hypothetical protein